MTHIRLTYKHTYLDIALEPATYTGQINMHGVRHECITAVKENFEEMELDIAEDGTEAFTMIDIVEVIEEA